MSFYRKYRPQVIEDIDNVTVREQLLSLLTKEKNELPHAYLFCGPRGAGKTTAARVVAKIFNCEKSTKQGPCGTCDQCVSIAQNTNMDVLEIDAASNRGIDEIRTLREAIALSPVGSGYKLYIIDEVHMLTTEAFNALLKTLEEPPAHAIFVLATTDPQKVPITIRSRCMVVTFGRGKNEELRSALTRIAAEEKMKIADSALDQVIRFADGSFRDAVKLLEQVSFSHDEITTTVVEKLLSGSSQGKAQEFIETLGKKDAVLTLNLIKNLVEEGKDIKTFLHECLMVLERMLVTFVEGKPQVDWSISDIQKAIRKLSQAYTEMRDVSIPQLPLELAVVEYCESSPVIPTQVENTSGPTPRHSEPIKSKGEESQANFVPTGDPSLIAQDDKKRVTVDKKEERKDDASTSLGLLSLEKLTDCWKDFIEAMKEQNHSVAGVLRSARPKAVKNGIVTIEAFYPFHQEKLNESKTRDAIIMVLKKLFGEKVHVEVVLGKK